MDYKKRISQLKDERSWSAHHLAIEAGLNTSTVSNWFNRNSSPTTDAIEQLCDALGITLSEFFNETGEITTLTDEQKELLEIWNILQKNEKKAFMDLIRTVNSNKKAFINIKKKN